MFASNFEFSLYIIAQCQALHRSPHTRHCQIGGILPDNVTFSIGSYGKASIWTSFSKFVAAIPPKAFRTSNSRYPFLTFWLWWFSVETCKNNPGYKSHDLLWFECYHWLKLQHSDWRANLVKDSFLHKFSTNDSTRFITRLIIKNSN